MIGQYSVLYHTDLLFNIKARSANVRVLTLDESFFVDYVGDKMIEGIQECMV